MVIQKKKKKIPASTPVYLHTTMYTHTHTSTLEKSRPKPLLIFKTTQTFSEFCEHRMPWGCNGEIENTGLSLRKDSWKEGEAVIAPQTPQMPLNSLNTVHFLYFL